MMFTYPLYATYFDVNLEGIQPLFAYLSLMLTLPVMGYSAYPIFKRMKHQLKEGWLGMETLVGMAASAALILSLMEMLKGTYHVYFDTITVLIAFLLLGKIIESQAKFSTKSALTRLHYALPRKGRKVFDGDEARFVPIKDIIKGDKVMALTGEKIVLDGQVVAGDGYCDESLITGEAKPVKKLMASKVLAGTVVHMGYVTYQVTSELASSTLNKILSLVEKEVGGKSVFTSPLESLVKWFTPLVIALAIFTILGALAMGLSLHHAIERGLALLLISCPCAIGIATPLVESRLLHQFAQMGAIVRNRRVFTLFPKITHFVFDKTGTLTEGVLTCSGVDAIAEKALLKGLALKSRHPVAQAIAQAIEPSSVELTSIQEIAGRGICGMYDGRKYALGSYQFLLERGLSTSLVGDVYFFSSDEVLGVLMLKDQVRACAYETLDCLCCAQRIVLSGDSALSVEKLAKTLPLDDWKGSCSPLEKQQYIADLQEHGALVAMVGDGINDSPALVKADIGISMVSATDISIQVSDLLLTKQQLTLIPALQKLAHLGSKIIKQNLFWAFAYNGAGIILAISGILTPLFASFAMIMSSLMVLCNAQRLTNSK
jgi:Cu2+-exporting ATPase